MTDEIKYVECPACVGLGEILEANLYPTGHSELWLTCQLCDGRGKFDEDDFIMMRLEGIV